MSDSTNLPSSPSSSLDNAGVSPTGSANTPSRTADPSLGIPAGAAAERVGSMTLLQLPASRRPSPSTVCEICPASMWMASAKTVTNFCRVMRLVTWATDKPTVLSHCDGMHLAEEGQA